MWEDILRLNEDELNRALEAVSSALHTTASWDAVAPLLWHYGLSLQMLGADRALCWYAEDAEDERCLTATSEHEARVHLCRLVLWRAQRATPDPAVEEAPWRS